MKIRKNIASSLLILTILLGAVLSTNAQDVSMLYEQLNPSVVTIQVKEYKVQNQQITSSSGLGSGVIISSDGLILTAAHVVNFANEVIVKLQDESIIQADVLISSMTADIALLKLRKIPTNLKSVEMGDSDLIKIGEQIILIGAPLGFEHSLSVGHVSKKFKRNTLTNGENAGFIQTDASINQGNSGGPMFNLDGELIGIVSFILSKSGGFEGLGFAADINSIKKTLLDVNTFWTGFEGIFLNDAMAGIFNVPQKSGVLVQRVTPDSFASKIGLKPGLLQAEIFGQKLWIGGDIILSIQGLSCNAPHDLGTIKAQIETLKEGDKVLIEVLRKGNKVILEGNFLK